MSDNPRKGKRAKPYLVLSINAKFASAPDELHRESRRLRWERLATVRDLLGDERLAIDGMILKNAPVGKRVSKCMWVNVQYVVEHWRMEGVKGSSHFRGVATCGSVWMCPICAAKITERRKLELQIAVTEAQKRCWHVYMVTYTLQHKGYEPIEAVLKKLIAAVRKIKGGRAWERDFRSVYDWKGSVTALEMTYSFENGGHPHKHVMELLGRKLTEEEKIKMRDDLAIKYQNILAGLDGYADFEIAVNVRDATDYIAEYIAKFGYEPKARKWGVSDEMAKYPVKGKGMEEGHYTMFQLLDLYKDGNLDAGRVFAEFAVAFRGRSQLTWSNGLKKEFGIKEKTDAEIAKEQDAESKAFALYQKKDWHKVRKIPFDVLDAGDWMKFESFKKYLASMEIEVESTVFTLVNNGFGDGEQ